ncbi:DnaJ-class molecular chaperone [Streptomyces syringium]|uniref:DnaJ-class molecular chaperone n=1 Tax=Streptomyces syringium TaxID=76729 RepID=A0ABS4Y5S9_9ACTN|nr:DnaJ-class molecular chaperone [Streptomyces syringium]
MPMRRVRCPICKGERRTRKTRSGRWHRCRCCRGTGTIR